MQTIMRFLISEYLGLDEAQQEAVREVREAAMAGQMELRRQIAENMKAVHEAAKNGEPIDLLAEEHGRLMTEALKQRVGVRTAVRAALNLTPEQQEKLDRIFELMSQMRPEPGQFGPPEGAPALP